MSKTPKTGTPAAPKSEFRRVSLGPSKEAEAIAVLRLLVSEYAKYEREGVPGNLRLAVEPAKKFLAWYDRERWYVIKRRQFIEHATPKIQQWQYAKLITSRVDGRDFTWSDDPADATKYFTSDSVREDLKLIYNSFGGQFYDRLESEVVYGEPAAV